MSMWIVAPVFALLVYAVVFRALELSEKRGVRSLGSWTIVIASVIACVLFELQHAHFGGLRPARIALDLLLMASLPAIFPIEAMWLARLFTRRWRTPLGIYLIAFTALCGIVWAITAYIGSMLIIFVRL